MEISKKINIYFVRHAQGIHNLDTQFENDPAYRDAILTEEGQMQSTKLGKKIKDLSFTAYYCSPLIRCIQTLSYALDKNLHFNKDRDQIILDDNLMEQQGDWCNIRRDKSDLECVLKNFDKKFNLDKVSTLRQSNGPEELRSNIYKRIRDFLIELIKRPDLKDNDNIIVFTHRNYLKCLEEILKYKEAFLKAKSSITCDYILDVKAYKNAETVGYKFDLNDLRWLEDLRLPIFDENSDIVKEIIEKKHFAIIIYEKRRGNINQKYLKYKYKYLQLKLYNSLHH